MIFFFYFILFYYPNLYFIKLKWKLFSIDKNIYMQIQSLIIDNLNDFDNEKSK